MPRAKRDVPWLDTRDNGVWYAFWYNEKTRQTDKESLKTKDAGEAKRKFAEFLLRGPEPRRDADLTVAQALDDYFREHCSAVDDKNRPLVADATRQANAITHLKAWFGAAAIRTVGPAESRAYVAARRAGETGRTGTDSTIRRELNVLVAAANHAAKWERLPRNDLPRVELPSEERGLEVEWLTKEQVRLALEKTADDPDLHDFILLAYYTAARRNSIENLTRFQVDLANGRINLMTPGARATKKRKPIVPIYPEIRPVIERRLEAFEVRLLPARNYYRAFKRLLADMGVDGHPHMLRHSRATHLLMDGENIYKVARLLGDTVATVENVYGHSDPEFLATSSGVK